MANDAKFNFYLNRQGARGQKGEKGDQGFSPSITVNTNTADEYTLLIQNEYDSLVTDNIRPTYDDRGGTYVRVDRANNVQYFGSADIATTANYGEVKLAQASDLASTVDVGNSNVITAELLKTWFDGQLADNLVTTTNNVTIQGQKVFATPTRFMDTVRIGNRLMVTQDDTGTITFDSGEDGTLIGTHLTSTGDARFMQNVTVDGTATIEGGLNVAGNAVISNPQLGNTTISGDLTTNADINIQGQKVHLQHTNPTMYLKNMNGVNEIEIFRGLFTAGNPSPADNYLNLGHNQLQLNLTGKAIKANGKDVATADTVEAMQSDLNIAKQDIIEAQGDIDNLQMNKQNKLTAGTGITIDADNVISATGGVVDIPIASSTTLGGIKVGENLTISEDGTLSATSGGTGDVSAAGDNTFTGENTFNGAVNLNGTNIAENLTVTRNLTSSGEINAVSIKTTGLRSDDIKTTTNKKYLTEVDVDNQTIQVVDGKISSTTPITYLTRAQYDALEAKDANTMYVITDEEGGGSGYSLFDLKYSDHILEGNEAKGFALLGSYAYKTAVAGSRYGYPDFYNKCVAEKIAGTETTITVGDYSFTGYKNANGHIFFDIADKDTVDNIYTSTGKAWYYGIDTANERIFLPRVKNALVGMADIANTSAVVPNTTNPMPQFTVHNDLDAVGNLHTFSVSGSTFNQVHWNGRQGNNDGNLLWTTKGNTGLLSDNSNVKSALNNDNFYIYMCVGNTEQESAVTDVIDITTSENDTFPLGFSTYQGEGTQPSPAWLKSSGQWNSGEVYATFYNYYVAKIGQAFGAGFVKAHTASDITDYDLVINQDEQTFRLPLKNGKENLVGNEYIQINTLPANDTTLTAPANGYYTISAWASATKSCFYMTNLSNNLTVGEAGANLSNTYWNYVMPCKKGDKIQFHYESIAIQDGNFYFCPNIGNGTLYYKVSNAVQNLQLLDVAEVTTALANKQDKCIHIIETYVNGTSGYRIWSDGYCEQWAHKDNWGDISSFTFLKTFKDTNYIVVFNGRKDDSTSNLGITTITTTTINYNNSDTSLNGDLLAKGYLARGEY